MLLVYNPYVNAVQQRNPEQQAQSLEAFLQTYPHSVTKEDALEMLMVAYQNAGESQKTIDTAERILHLTRTSSPSIWRHLGENPSV